MKKDRQIGTIDSVWRYPVKGMRGEEVPHIYTAYTGLMGDRIYGVVAADGDPGHPWHTGRNQEEFLLYRSQLRCERRSCCYRGISTPPTVNGNPASIHSIRMQMRSR